MLILFELQVLCLEFKGEDKKRTSRISSASVKLVAVFDEVGGKFKGAMKVTIMVVVFHEGTKHDLELLSGMGMLQSY